MSPNQQQQRNKGKKCR